MATDTESRLVPEHTDRSSEVQHGVHVVCQMTAPFVVSVCGLALSWEERGDRDGLPLCDRCGESRRCPVCGAHMWGWM